MDLTEAIKAVKKPTDKKSFLIIKFKYDCQLILPYKDAINFISCLENAELFECNWSEEKIKPLSKDTFEVMPFSNEDYENHKIAALLGMKVIDVVEQLKSTKT